MSTPRAVACDVGTMFFQTAEFNTSNEIESKTIRNAFVELEKTDGTNDMLKQNGFQYVQDEKNVYVIGEDAIRFARMLPGKVELRRPLQDGVLNAGEDMKMLVLNEMVRSLVGKAPDNKSVVCTCVSSPPVDGAPDNTFHERRLKGMFENQGWHVVVDEKGKLVQEALAVILAENPKAVDDTGAVLPYTGIGLSFGAGRVNAVLAYKGVTAVGMSCARSGDWIDREVAGQINQPIAKVTAYKEKNLNFDTIEENIVEGKDVSDMDFALDAYYEAMLKYVFDHFARKFASVQSDFDMPLEIVAAGGTSMPTGFIGKLRRVLNGLTLPFKIKEVRHAKDPRNTVVNGLLLRAKIAQKELVKQDSPDELLSK